MISKMYWKTGTETWVDPSYPQFTEPLYYLLLTTLYTFEMKDIVSVDGLNPPKAIYGFSTIPNVDGAKFNTGRIDQRRISIIFKVNNGNGANGYTFNDYIKEINTKLASRVKGVFVVDSYNPKTATTTVYYLWNTYIENVDYNIFNNDIYFTVDFISENSYFNSALNKINFSLNDRCTLSDMYTENPVGTGFIIKMLYKQEHISDAVVFRTTNDETNPVQNMEVKLYPTFGTQINPPAILTIDTINKTVKSDEVPNPPISVPYNYINNIDTDFKWIKATPNIKKIEFTHTLDTVAKIYILFRSEFIGVN